MDDHTLVKEVVRRSVKHGGQSTVLFMSHQCQLGFEVTQGLIKMEP